MDTPSFTLDYLPAIPNACRDLLRLYGYVVPERPELFEHDLPHEAKIQSALVALRTALRTENA